MDGGSETGRGGERNLLDSQTVMGKRMDRCFVGWKVPIHLGLQGEEAGRVGFCPMAIPRGLEPRLPA